MDETPKWKRGVVAGVVTGLYAAMAWVVLLIALSALDSLVSWSLELYPWWQLSNWVPVGCVFVSAFVTAALMGAFGVAAQGGQETGPRSPVKLILAISMWAIALLLLVHAAYRVRARFWYGYDTFVRGPDMIFLEGPGPLVFWTSVAMELVLTGLLLTVSTCLMLRRDAWMKRLGRYVAAAWRSLNTPRPAGSA